MSYIIDDDNICSCYNNCQLLTNSFATIDELNEMITYKIKNILHNLDVPQFRIFTNNRKIFHIKWYSPPLVFHRRALDHILLSFFIPKSIVHYTENLECCEEETESDFNYATKLYHILQMNDVDFRDLKNKYQDVCAFLELRKTKYRYLTLYNKFDN